MKISDAYPSKYLKSSDLQGREIKVVISHVTIEELTGDRGAESKPVLYFEGKQKGVVLNRTNSDTISHAYGDETDDWPGCELIIFSQRVQGPNGMTDGIRFRIPPRKAGKATITSGVEQIRRQETPPLTDDEMNDSIPF